MRVELPRPKRELSSLPFRLMIIGDGWRASSGGNAIIFVGETFWNEWRVRIIIENDRQFCRDECSIKREAIYLLQMRRDSLFSVQFKSA